MTMMPTIVNTTPVMTLLSSEPIVVARCWRRSLAMREESRMD